MVELERMYPRDTLLYSETSHLTTDEDDAECNGDSPSDISPYQSPFLADLKSRDKGKRGKALDCMAACLEQWARSSDDLMSHRSLSAHLPIALRLTLDSPFADIRDRLKRILEQLKVSFEPSDCWRQLLRACCGLVEARGTGEGSAR